jgi:hypothetical protein
MAKDKKVVLLYCDLIHTVEKMDDETAGIFFKHYLRYINDLNPTTNNIVVDIAFESVKQNLKRDLKKWEERAERSRNNGKLGGRPKTQTNPKKPSGLINNPNEPKKPVKGTVTVNVTDTVNVKVKDINNKGVSDKSEHDPFLNFNDEVKICTKACLKYFDEHLLPKTNKSWLEWLKTIDKLIRIDNIPSKKIIEIVKETRNDDFWSKNFLTLTKLRRKNNDGLMYALVFNENLKRNEKKSPKSNYKNLQRIADERYGKS